MKYSLNLAHLYGDLLNTYGDIGNILALRYYAKQMDTNLKVDIISLNQEFNPEKYDIAWFGGGQDDEQIFVLKEIQLKKEKLTK